MENVMLATKIPLIFYYFLSFVLAFYCKISVAIQTVLIKIKIEKVSAIYVLDLDSENDLNKIWFLVKSSEIFQSSKIIFHMPRRKFISKRWNWTLFLKFESIQQKHIHAILVPYKLIILASISYKNVKLVRERFNFVCSNILFNQCQNNKSPNFYDWL